MKREEIPLNETGRPVYKQRPSLLRLRLGRQTHAQRPFLRELFHRKPPRERVILDAYRRHGYRLAEIAAHLGVHYATISRRVRRAEQRMYDCKTVADPKLLRADGWTNVKAGIDKSRTFAEVLVTHRMEVVLVPEPDKGEVPKKAKAVKEWKDIRKKL